MRVTDGVSPLIIGIGASAGGLEAVQELLTELGDAPGFAIVFVQHLDPSSKTLLVELLSKTTTMSVVEIAARQKLTANVVYVCPPQTLLELKKGVLSIAKNEAGQRHPASIDHFFHALAEDQGERGIGVILSGSGSDGTLGLKAISDRGGLTFAQDSDSASYDSMPRSAATTGVADHVLPPAAIALELLNYARHMGEVDKPQSRAQQQEEIKQAIPQIAEKLMEVTQHNFQHYKLNTLTRRIARRMQVLKIASVSRYVEHLQQHEAETRLLFRELLIGVTAFFRDPDAFALLKETVLPKLFKHRASGDCVRIWVAGCASGQEAYTLAILCREVMDELKSPCGVQIFATDIDERALGIARAGAYPMGIEEQLSPERLKRFFVKRGKQYHVTKEIREIVLFSVHNLISDPPFSRLDLISCRNLLIYLGSHLQYKLIPLFHYALRPNGALFLGPSENIMSHAELFLTLDVKHRISERKATAIGASSTSLYRSPSPAQQGRPLAPDAETDFTAIRQRITLDEFAPQSAVIDQDGHILNASADIQKYLSVSGGDYQNNIMKMAARGLRIGLRAAIVQAKKSRRRVDHDDLSIGVGDLAQRVMITVQPMPRLGEEQELFMVVFQDLGKPFKREEVGARVGSRGIPDQPQQSRARVENDAFYGEAVVTQLEQELEAARHELSRIMQDMEAANEELKSSNEELLSMNEELQSANEELETSREEIRASSDAVERAHADLKNLLRSSRIPTVFLDNDLKIRSFTPAIADIYSLISTDVGRPLQNFVPNVKQMPALPSVAEVIEAFDQHTEAAKPLAGPATALDCTVVTQSGKTYIRRVLPFQSHSGETQGLVVTFADVTELTQSQQRFRTLVEASAQIVWVTDTQGEVVADSPSWRAVTGQTYEQWVGRGWLDAVHPDDRPATLKQWQNAVQTGQTLEMEYRLRYACGEYRWSHVRAVPERAADGSIKSWVGMNMDVTERKIWEAELADRETQLRRLIDNTIAFISVLEVDGTLREANAPALKVAGLSREDVVGKQFEDLYWWNFDAQLQEKLQALIARAASGVAIREDLTYRSLGDEIRPLDFMLNPVMDDTTGQVSHLIASAIDIFDRKNTEEELARAKRRLDLTLEVSEVAPWSWNATTNEIVPSPMLNRLFEFDENAQPTVEDFISRLVESDRERVINALEQTTQHGQDYDIDYQVVPPSGKVRHVRACGKPQFSSDGTLIDFMGVAIDITARKQWELELVQREAHLRRVINNQLGLVGVIDCNGILLEIDDRSLGIACTSRRQVIGKHFADAPWWNYDPVVVQKIRHSMQRAFAGEVVRYDVSLCAEDDTGVMIDFMIAPAKNAAGEVEYLIYSGVDIRERHAAEVQSRKSEELVRTIAENSTQGLVMMDDRGYVTYCNQALLDMTGYDADEIRSAPLHNLIHHHYPNGEPYPIHECPIDRALPEDFSVRAHEDLFFRKDGSTFSVMCAASPIFLDGRPVSTVIEVRDVTDQQRQRSELKLAAARLENSMAFAGIAAWGWDREKQRLVLDAQLKRMWGFDAGAEVSLDDFTLRIEDSHRQRVISSIGTAMQSFSAYREEYPIRLPTGQQRWIRAIGQAQPAADGKIEDFFGVTIDVTIDRRREHKARFRAELLEALTKLSDPEDIMRMATRRIAEHFHASRCYLARIRMDDQTTEVFHESHAEHLSTIVGVHQISNFLTLAEQNSVGQGHPVRIDDIRQSDRGQEKVRRFDALGITSILQGSFESSNNLFRTLFITKQQAYRWREDELRFLDDLTEMTYLRIERAQAQLELEQARVAAEAASASKSAFVANMSHEIRTPMTAILGYADLIRDRITDEEATSHLQTIRRNGDYLLEIINDILDLSKIEAGKLDIESERFRPVRLIEDVRRIMEVRATEGGLKLDVEYDGPLPKYIESDAKRLKQILINLVGNAIKFTRAGHVKIRVRFETTTGNNCSVTVPLSADGSPADSRAVQPTEQAFGGNLFINVIDTGIGMSNDQQSRLFRPFSQGDSSVSRHFGGTGLGLAISQRLAGMLGGSISASSTLGVGSTFTVSIATAYLGEDEFVDCVQLAEKTPISDRSHENRNNGQGLLANCHVLIVDDRRDIRLLSKKLLTKAGASVDECEDGQLAVEHMTDCVDNKNCPDLILLDMQMPNLDGYETARALRQLGYPGPIIALTANAMEGNSNECIAAGCNAYLSKPIDAKRLIQMVQLHTDRDPN